MEFSWNEFLFALVLTRVNVVALTLLVHRHLVTGLTLGAFK